MAGKDTADTDTGPTTESIALDTRSYLRENPGVCARGNAHGITWIRFNDGEWRGTKYSEGNDHHSRGEYVIGCDLDADGVLQWLVDKPVELIPSSEAYLWSPKDHTVWEEAGHQDVFTEHDRCFWCGDSERTVTLTTYETTDQGVCSFCPDCYESWNRAGEIVNRSPTIADYEA